MDPDNPNETFECFLTEADLAEWTDVEAKQQLLRESYIDPLYFTVGSGEVSFGLQGKEFIQA